MTNQTIDRPDWSAPTGAEMADDILPVGDATTAVVPAGANGGRDLARADERGVPLPIDGDRRPGTPLRAEDFDLGRLPFFDGADRYYLDRFADFAAGQGLTQREFDEAAAFVLSTPPEAVNVASFMAYATGRGWRPGEISAVLGFADRMMDERTAAPSRNVDRLLDEIASLEALMRADRRAYEKGGGERRYRALLHERDRTWQS